MADKVPQSAVTLEEAKKHLRVEHSLDDDYIMSLCVAYTDVAAHNLERPIFGEGGLADSVEDVPPSVKFWVLLHVGTLYENRESAGTTELKIQPHVAGLLIPYKIWGRINATT